jgi:hypothetical protein
MAPDYGPKIEAVSLQTVRFRYINWRGNKHVYEVDVESFQFGPFEKGGVAEDPTTRNWVMHGHVVTRDGVDRPEMGDNRRRTFVLSDIRDLEIVDE